MPCRQVMFDSKEIFIGINIIWGKDFLKLGYHPRMKEHPHLHIGIRRFRGLIQKLAGRRDKKDLAAIRQFGLHLVTIWTSKIVNHYTVIEFWAFDRVGWKTKP